MTKPKAPTKEVRDKMLRTILQNYFDAGFVAFSVRIDIVEVDGEKTKDIGWPVEWKEIKTIDEAISKRADDHNAIALVLGDDHFLVDADLYKPGAKESLKELNIDESQAIVQTIRGGTHSVFRTPANLRKKIKARTDILPGIDIKVGNGIEFVPLSNNGSKGYQFINGHSFESYKTLGSPSLETTKKLLELFTEEIPKERPRKASEDTDYAFVPSAVEYLRRVRLGYDEWYRAGMAISEMGEAGRIHWLDLSDNPFHSDQPRMLNTKYNNFLEKTESVSIATFFDIAIKHGYEYPVKEVFKKNGSLPTEANKRKFMEDSEDTEDKEEEEPSFLYAGPITEAPEELLSDSEWLVDNLFLKNDISTLNGIGGHGKSTLATNLMVAIVTKQKEFLGRELEIKSGKVLIYETEERLKRIITRAEMNGATREQIGNIHTIVPNKAVKFTEPNLELLKEMHMRNRYDLVVMSAFDDLLFGANLNKSKNDDIRGFIGKIKQQAEINKMSVVLVSHPRKLNSTQVVESGWSEALMGGSSSISQLVRCNLWIHKLDTASLFGHVKTNDLDPEYVDKILELEYNPQTQIFDYFDNNFTLNSARKLMAILLAPDKSVSTEKKAEKFIKEIDDIFTIMNPELNTKRLREMLNEKEIETNTSNQTGLIKYLEAKEIIMSRKEGKQVLYKKYRGENEPGL